MQRTQSPRWRGLEQSTFPHDSGTNPAAQHEIVPLCGMNPARYDRGRMSLDPDAPWHPTRIVERIAAQVERLGVSRTSLLKAANVPEKSVRDLEDSHWPNLRRVAQLAKAFK